MQLDTPNVAQKQNLQEFFSAALHQHFKPSSLSLKRSQPSKKPIRQEVIRLATTPLLTTYRNAAAPNLSHASLDGKHSTRDKT
jgi:hypothetical protein